MTKIDGIKPNFKKVYYRNSEKQKSLPKPESKIQAEKKKYFNTRNTTFVIGAFAVAFAASFAVGAGIAHVRGSQIAFTGTPQVLGASIKAPPIQIDSPFPVTNEPQTLTLDMSISDIPGKIYLPLENITVPDPLTDTIKNRQEFLRQYLTAKHSVLADHVETLSKVDQWRLIVAISRAESSFCKRSKVNNCWGIGGAWNLRQYDNYDQAIEDVNRLLLKKYTSIGLNSPGKMVNKWVGHPNASWEIAVQQELDNLKNIQ